MYLCCVILLTFLINLLWYQNYSAILCVQKPTCATHFSNEQEMTRCCIVYILCLCCKGNMTVTVQQSYISLETNGPYALFSWINFLFAWHACLDGDQASISWACMCAGTQEPWIDAVHFGPQIGIAIQHLWNAWQVSFMDGKDAYCPTTYIYIYIYTLFCPNISC